MLMFLKLGCLNILALLMSIGMMVFHYSMENTGFVILFSILTLINLACLGCITYSLWKKHKAETPYNPDVKELTP